MHNIPNPKKSDKEMTKDRPIKKSTYDDSSLEEDIDEDEISIDEGILNSKGRPRETTELYENPERILK